MPLHKIPYLVFAYRFTNHLFYEVVHDLSGWKDIAIGKTIDLKY